MEIGVVPDFFCPAPHEVSPSPPIERERIGINAAAGRLEMDKDRLRRPNVGPAVFGYPQAEIDVVEINREVVGVESADRLEFISRDSDAGGCHGGYLMGRGEPAAIAGIVRRHAAIEMS